MPVALRQAAHLAAGRLKGTGEGDAMSSGHPARDSARLSAAVWREAPSWLVSAVLHLAVLVLLGLIYYTGELAEISQLSISWSPTEEAPLEETHVLFSSPA